MKTACLCAICFGLCLLSVGAGADPSEEMQSAASPDYRLFVDPPAPDVTQKTGGSAAVTVGVRVLPINAFRLAVHLSAADLPPGVSAAFTPRVAFTASGDVHGKIVFRVAPTTRPGLYEIDVLSKVEGSRLTRHTPVSLMVSPPVHATRFTLGLSPDGLDIEPGRSDTVTLTLKPGAGFHGPVTLRLQDDPAAPLLSGPVLHRRTLSAAHPSTTLTIRPGPHALEGFHNLLVTATAATGTQTIVLPVSVLPDERGARPAPMPTITEMPNQPHPPLADGPEDMLRFNTDETDDSKIARNATPRPQAIPHSPSPAGLITLRATIKDSAGRPIAGAVLIVTDGNLKQIKKPDSVVRFSDAKGQTYTQVLSAPGPCYVTVNAQGYLPPIIEEISEADDADLTFVLKRRPKVSPPKRTSPQPSP